MKLYDLVPNIHSLIVSEYVNAREHPTLPLTIFNYSKRAQREWKFDENIGLCRGLIAEHYNHPNERYPGVSTRLYGDLVARPWPKFFNIGEAGAPDINPDESCWVANKYDGSLIILVNYRDQWVVASRGSFDSDQAKLAMKAVALEGWWPYADRDVGKTYLYELVGPSNRIVLDYPRDKLVYLDTIVNETGLALGGGQVMTVREALALPDRPNAEGYVLTFDDGRMVKVKQQDYIEKHRVIFGLNERVVWEWLRDGTSGERVLDLPEELRPWAEDTLDRLRDAIWDIEEQVADDFRDWQAWIQHHEIAEPTRREFAEFTRSCDYPHLMFRKYDKKELRPVTIEMVKPRGDAKPEWS